MPRLELTVRVLVKRNVPPVMFRLAGVAAPGAAPSCASEETLTVPALTVKGPPKALFPERVNKPGPVLDKPKAPPETTPEMVRAALLEMLIVGVRLRVIGRLRVSVTSG